MSREWAKPTGPSGSSTRPRNGSSRLRHIVSPLGKTTHFTYSFKGNLEAVENHYGTVGYEYDNLQRFVKRSLPDGTVDEIAYRDVLGNVDSAVRTVLRRGELRGDVQTRMTRSTG